MALVDTTNKFSVDTTLALTHSSAPRVRLEFLDGLRGIAALYVVLFHATYFAGGMKLSFLAQGMQAGLRFGHYAVDVFIVLSGYCLMIPVARSADKQIPRGVVDYIKRRARRILPPYYIVLILSLALVMAGQFLSHTGKVQGKAIPEVLTPGILLSHLFVVHNLSFDWAFRINAPLWSVATEWQIYFIFPCLLLPVWRRTGEVVTVLLAFLIGILPLLLLPADGNFWWASPWFIGLFAMGMAAASANFGGPDAAVQWRKTLVSPLTMLALLAAFVMLNLAHAPALVELVGSDFLLGLASSGLIMFCAQAAMSGPQQQKRPLLLRLLEAPAVVRLGVFSYSLYLIHHPLQQIALRVLQTRVHSPEILLYLQLAVSTPLIVAAAYLFHIVCERPFLSHARQKA